jgi:hypothetical protein
MLRIIPLLLTTLVLAGCQTALQKEIQDNRFARADGRSIHSSPALLAQAQLDVDYCKGEANKAALSAAPIYAQGIVGMIAADQVNQRRQEAVFDVMKGCMAGKGYAWGPKAG